MKEGETFQEQFIVSEEVYQSFIVGFKDKNPLHTDIAFAKAKGFKDVVIHGNILNGFISYFIGECLPYKEVMIISQTISYHNPFFLNDKLVFDAKIVMISNAYNTIEFKYVFRNEEKKRIAKGNIVLKNL